MGKLTKQETVKIFTVLAREHNVLDYLKSGGGHDRFYLGKRGASKPLFLACSRVGWLCVYVDSTEKQLLLNNGFACEQVTSSDEGYAYRTRVNVDEFETFLNIVKEYLKR